MTDERFLLLALLMMIAFWLGHIAGERERHRLAHELAYATPPVALRGTLSP